MTTSLPEHVQRVFDRFRSRLVGGFEVPASRLAVLRGNAAKALRFRRTAKRELARRT